MTDEVRDSYDASKLGLTAAGYDLSPGQIAQARKAFPDSQFDLGDLAALEDGDSSLGGIVSRHTVRPQGRDGV